MDTNHQRERLHDFLENASPQRVAAIYALVENELAHGGVSYDADLRAKLEQRRQDFENDLAQPVSSIQSKARIAELLKSGREQ